MTPSTPPLENVDQSAPGSDRDTVADGHIAGAVVEIAAQLVQAPASAEVTMLEWAFERIAAVSGASIVAARELREDGLLHFVAGWSRIDRLLDGEQPRLRLRHSHIPRELVSTRQLMDMPVVPMSLGDVDNWQNLIGVETPQSVFIPMIASEEPKGFLCLVADDGVTWNDNILSALTTVTALVTQFRSRVVAERSMQREIAFNKMQLKIGDQFLTVARGEADDVLIESLNDVGRLLDVISISVWERKLTQQAHRTFRWINDGLEAKLPQHRAVDIDALPEALRISAPDRTARLTLESDAMLADFDDLHVEREHLVVQMTAQLGRGGALVVGYSPERRWEPWEVAGLESFANRILILRDKLALEEQLTASFHAAPVGISVRNAEGRLIGCNDAFVSFLGYESEVELLGTRPEDVMTDSATSDRVTALWRKDDDARIELPFTRKDGSIVWARLSARVLELGPDLMTLTHIEDITAERFERIRLEERASTDELTGMANRHRMHATLTRLLSMTCPAADPRSATAAVLLLDLDGFKQVNDLYGHAIGDRVLQHVSHRLVAASRETDTVVRLGGDEFLVILPGPINVAAAKDAAARIRNAVAEPLTVADRNIHMTVSIGVATSADNQSVDSLLAAADIDMYAEKRAAAGRREEELRIDGHLLPSAGDFRT